MAQPIAVRSSSGRMLSSVNLLFLLLAIAAAVMAICVVRVPLILDYPNHYVRLWLLLGGVDDPTISRMYAENWRGATTNIAIDAVAEAFRGILPVTVVGPGLLIAAAVLPATGVALLGRRLFGGLHWWHVLCFLLCWNFNLVAGFLNFLISLGMALVAASLDGQFSGRAWGRAAAWRFIAGAAILVAHPFGALFYCILVAGIAIGPSFSGLRSRAGFWSAFRRALAAAMPVILPVVLLLVFAPSLPGDHDKGGKITWQDPTLSSYMKTLLSPLLTYDRLADLAVVAFLLLVVAAAAITRRLRVHGGLMIMSALLLAGALVMPRGALGTYYLHVRLPEMMVLCFAVAVLPAFPLSRRSAAAAAAAAALVAVGRTWWVGSVWLARDADLASVERTFSQIPPGSAILPLDRYVPGTDLPLGRLTTVGQETYMHLPVLAIMERKAFEPLLFTALGKQPIRVLPPWSDIAVPEGPLQPVEVLKPGADLSDPPYLAHWRSRFDYILVVNADVPDAGDPLAEVQGVSLVSNEGFARLYKVIR